MNEKITKHFDAGQFVKELPNEVFHEEFINKLGRTTAFSKLRSGGEDRMTGYEWGVVERGYKNLGVPDTLSTDQMIALAYALTARAVTSAHF